jgi:hypothetical protein
MLMWIRMANDFTHPFRLQQIEPEEVVFIVIAAIQVLRYLHSATPAILPGNAN